MSDAINVSLNAFPYMVYGMATHVYLRCILYRSHRPYMYLVRKWQAKKGLVEFRVEDYGVGGRAGSRVSGGYSRRCDSGIRAGGFAGLYWRSQDFSKVCFVVQRVGTSFVSFVSWDSFCYGVLFG